MSDPASAPVAPKPGYLTTEFYLKLAALLLTALYASGVIPTSGIAATVAAIAATMLGALGYTVSRTLAKTSATSDAPPPSQPVANVLTVVPAPPKGFAALPLMALLAIAGAALLVLGGCGAKSTAAEHAFIDCEEQAVKDKVPQLLPTVMAILSSGVADWKAQLEALGQYAGEATLACTVKAAGALFASHKVGGPIAGGHDAELRASTITSDHRWSFKAAPTP